jgi:integrase
MCGTVRAHPSQKSGSIVYTGEMPWMETNAMDQRRRFVLDYESGQWSMSELCERYGITRPTGYKWVERVQEEGRAAADSGRKIQPIENPAALHRLVEEARKRGADTLLFVLLCFDAGLRVSEALGLSWDRIGWGADDNDTSRHLMIDQSSPQGGKLEATKSGRAGKVAMSRRLQHELRDCFMASGRPDPSTPVLPGMDPANFRKRKWVPMTARTGITGHTPKDLRDSYASYLLTAGVPLGYISKQLRHADIAITARHYARWIGDAYQQPAPLAEGDVPADLLARVSKERHEAGEKTRQAETSE